MSVDWSIQGLAAGVVPLTAAAAGALVATLLVLALLRWSRLRQLYSNDPSAKAWSAGDRLEVVVEEHAADAAKDIPLDVRALVAERPIGSGGQGGVWLAYDPTSGKRVALKQLRKGRLAALKRVASVKPETCQWLIEREALLKCGNHPFVTTCHATFQDDHSLFYALELASGGDLFSRLHTSESGQLPEAQCRFYTACVGLAIKHIHAMGFLYCDIKLENVLITSDGYVKLCDFGLAKKIAPRKRLLSFCAGEGRSYSKCGTDQYAPPEVVNGSGRAKGADWWALGVLLHEMLTGHSPFEGKGMAEIFARVDEYATGGAESCSQLRLDVMEDAPELSEAGVDFLLGLLSPCESKRIGCGRGGFGASVQAHAWFVGLDWIALLRQQLAAPWLPPAVTATDRKGSAAPTADEIRDEVAALFNPKTGVLRERPFEPSAWQHLFDPFGETVARLIKPPEPLAPTTSSVDDASSVAAAATTTKAAAASSAAASSAASSAGAGACVAPSAASDDAHSVAADAADDDDERTTVRLSAERASARGSREGAADHEATEQTQLRSLCKLESRSSSELDQRV